jgi:hypothetical protein
MAAFATTARAQTPAPATEKIFLNLNIGYQLADRSLSSESTKPIYDETARLTGQQDIGRGALLDLSLGVRVSGDIFVGVAASGFRNTQAAAFTARIPDPAVFDRFTTSTGSASGLRRTEVAVSPHVLWVAPLTDGIDISLAGGVAFFTVKQDVVGDFAIGGNNQVTTMIVNHQAKKVGPYAAIDFIYKLTDKYGAGINIRYAGAKVDIPSIGETNAGGLSIGGGVRLSF